MDSPPPSDERWIPPFASMRNCSSTMPWSKLRMMYELTTLPNISVSTPSSLLFSPIVPLPLISKTWLCRSMPLTVSFNQTVSNQRTIAMVPVPPSIDSWMASVPVPSSLDSSVSPTRCCQPWPVKVRSQDSLSVKLTLL